LPTTVKSRTTCGLAAGLDVHGHGVVEDAQIGGLPRGLDEGLEKRARREAQLVVPAAALGQGRDLRAGVVTAGVRVLPHVPPAEERREEAVDRADMELRPGSERRDADLAVRAGQGLEQIQGAVDRLDGAPRPARLGGFFHSSELPI